MLDKNRVKQIFAILQEYIPIPETELEYENPYTLLVAVILSAQSTDKQVNKVTDRLFTEADTPEKMVKLGYENLLTLINSVNLYKTKAKNIIGMSEMLIEKYNSTVPDNREDLMSLPGVGRKSADVMLNVVQKMPTIAVDTHVFRVAHRLELSEMCTRDRMAEDLEKSLAKCLDLKTLQEAHHLMVLHGRYVCKAQKPKCDICPLYDLCRSKDKISNAI
jgi:endonuclease-3